MLMTTKIAKPRNKFADFFGLDKPLISMFESKKTFWIIFAIVVLLLLPQYLYYDCVNAVRTSVNIWNALFDGELLNFYEYSDVFERCKTFPSFYKFDGGASYPMGAYFLLAIIDLPLFLIEKIFSCNLFANSLAVIYHKLCLVFISVFSGFLMRAMIRDYDPENKYADHAMLFYLSSVLFFTATVNIGQAEAITIFLMLLAIRFYLKDNMIGYVLMFATAINIKYFALILFVPLIVLLKEKRSWLHFIIGVTPVGLLMLLFGRKSIVAGIAGGRDYTDFVLGTFKVNIFMIAYILLLIYTFLQKPTTKSEKLHSIFTIGFLAYSSFFLLFGISYPYWTLLMVPFGIVAIITGKTNRRLMLWCFYLTIFALSVAQMLKYPWLFDEYALKNGFLPKILELSSANLENTLVRLGDKLGLPVFGIAMLAFSSLLFALYFFFIYLLQFRKSEIEVPLLKNNETDKELDKDAIIQLIASFALVCVPICIAYAAPVVKGILA